MHVAFWGASGHQKWAIRKGNSKGTGETTGWMSTKRAMQESTLSSLIIDMSLTYD